MSGLPTSVPGADAAAASALPGPVLVIGAGLLGASIGLGLSARGVAVQLRDASPTAEAVAQDLGAGRSERAAREAGEELPAPALIVVATPPDVVAETVAAQLRAQPRAVVTDVASVKAPIRADLQARGADLTRYVGSHPMAGREKAGPVAARGELFTSAPWVLCVGDDADPEAVRLVRAAALELGATVVSLPAQEHDEAVALISHLPQIMSSLLASRLQETPLHLLSLAGQGLRDTTRIAASDPQLWVQILTANAEAIVPSLRGVKADLDRLITTLEAPTAPGARLDVAQLISEGNAGQARIPGKHGGSPRAFAQLSVLIDDAPGTLARLLAEIGEIGVNLEDLRLEHSLGRQLGVAEVSVDPSRREELVDALQARGWKVVQ